MIAIMLRTRRRTTRRVLAATIVCAAGLASTDCSDSNEPSPPEGGEYTLVSISGQALPITIPNTALGTVVVQNGSATLTPGTAGDSTYTATADGTVNGESGTVLADAGTYSRSGSSMTFTSTARPGSVLAGTFVNDQLTITVPGESIGTTGTFVLELRK